MSGADALAAAAAAGESGKKMKAPKDYAKKADEAGEALKAKPAKVRRLKKSGARAERGVFFFPVPFGEIFPHLFLFFSLSPPPPPLSHLTNRSTLRPQGGPEADRPQKAGKADEAREALKAKPAKVRRLKEQQRAREREETCFLLPSIFRRSPHKFFLTSFSFLFSHLSTQVHEAGEALKVVKVPKAPKVSWQFR